MSKVQVSVVIPAYHCAETICEAVDSVLTQQVPLELLIIDDCPGDHLEEILRRYKNESRIRYYKNGQNIGVAASRNRGVQLAQGEYVAFLDSDDRWVWGKLEKQLALLQQTGAALCSTARELITLEGAPTDYVIPVPPEFTYQDLLRQNLINCSSVVLPTAVAMEFPMSCDEDSHEDYLTWLRVLRKYGRGVAVNEPLLQYRMGAAGKSGSKLHSAGMTFRTYRHMGFGYVKSSLCFANYALNGLRKYSGWVVGKGRGK